MAFDTIDKEITPTFYPLVFCKWLDATDVGTGWLFHEDLMSDRTNSLVYQAGYITREDEDNIWISGAIITGKAIADDTVSNTTRIPKGMIKELIYITHKLER